MASHVASYCLTLSALKSIFLYSCHLSFEICEATNKMLYFVAFIPLKSLFLRSSSHLVSWRTKSLRCACPSSLFGPGGNSGDPETLTPRLRTPTTYRVHGLPLRTPLRTTPQIIFFKKHKNKDFTYCLYNRSLVWAKFRALRWEN